jgi:hypothetical protein
VVAYTTSRPKYTHGSAGQREGGSKQAANPAQRGAFAHSTGRVKPKARQGKGVAQALKALIKK